jgi:MYXO-CTERM domain-containing protein
MTYKTARAISALILFAGLASAARADLLRNDTTQFAVLGQFSNNQTNFNNGQINGDIGIGTPRAFTASNGSVVGNIRFSGALNVSGLSGGAIPGPGPYAVSGGGTVSGGVFANDSTVGSAITYSNDLGQALGGNSGTALTIGSGGSVNVSAGTLGTTASVDGNALGTYRVFTVTSVNFPNGIFTINGSSSDQVVLNISSSANFHGQILLAGGIGTDNVIFNMVGGDYAAHTGGPTLDVQTNGLQTFATWLDPNGAMSATHTALFGRFFGGDTVNQQIVSGAFITAPPTQFPAPSALALLGMGALAARRRRGVRRMS